MMRIFLFVILALPFTASAEIYKWTDAEGRVHFGDKPTDQKVQAKEIEVKDYMPGTDAGTREINQRRQRVMNPGSEGKQKANEQDGANAAAEAQQQRCEVARDTLRKISGRVVFTDDNGKPLHVTEQQRIEKQRELDAWVRENCR